MNGNLRKALIILSLAFLSGACYLVGEPLQEARYREKGSRISRSDAKKLIADAAFAQALRCGGTNTGAIFLITSTIPVGACNSEQLDLFLENAVTGCAEKNFLDRGRVESCRMVVEAAPCGSTPFAGASLLAINVVCGLAFPL